MKRDRKQELIDAERRDRRNAILVYSFVAFTLGYLIGSLTGWP